MAHIRIAQKGDEDGIHYSHMISIREVCVHDHGPEEIKGWGYRERGTRWDSAVENGEVWVVEKEGQIEGHACIRMRDEQRAHVLGLYLTPTVIGQGFGKKLLLLMIEKAKQAGMKEVTLDSTFTAHDFYKSFGFVDTGPCEQHVIGGYPVSGIPMKLVLAE